MRTILRRSERELLTNQRIFDEIFDDPRVVYRCWSYDQFPLLDGIWLGQHEHHNESRRHVCHQRRKTHLTEAIAIKFRDLFRREMQPTRLTDLKSLCVDNALDLLPVDHRFRLHDGQSILDISFLLECVLDAFVALAEADRQQLQALIFRLVGVITFRRASGFVLRLSTQLLARDKVSRVDGVPFYSIRWRIPCSRTIST